MKTENALICYAVGIGWGVIGLFNHPFLIGGFVILGAISISMTALGN